jgi:hypothetical protein
MKTLVGLLLAFCLWTASAAAAQRAAAADGCDRECLRGQVTQLLNALVTHDVGGVPVADTVRVTEDAVDKPLAKVGLVTTVTRLRGFRQDIIDERAGVAASQVVVEETGAPVLLVVRVKVAAGKLTEIELVATRSRAEGLIFNIDGLGAPSAMMNYAPRPTQLASRDTATNAALKYPEGLNAAKTFADVKAPFAPNAYRYENGQVMAGPDCKFAPAARTSPRSRSRSSSASATCRRASSPWTSAWASCCCGWRGACASAAAINSPCGRPSRSSTARSMPSKPSCVYCRSTNATAAGSNRNPAVSPRRNAGPSLCRSSSRLRTARAPA